MHLQEIKIEKHDSGRTKAHLSDNRFPKFLEPKIPERFIIYWRGAARKMDGTARRGGCGAAQRGKWVARGLNFVQSRLKESLFST